VSALVLASRSPRRAALLDAAGIAYEVLNLPEVDETPPVGVGPREVVTQLAERKIRVAALLAPGRRILCADTLVFLEGRVLGKPADAAEARAMLEALSGSSHEVVTGVAVCGAPDGGRTRILVDAAGTKVRFRTLLTAEIEAYVASGEPLDKAGAYGIQGGAAGFVAALEGEIDAVIGLPVQLVRRLLGELAMPGPGTPGD